MTHQTPLTIDAQPGPFTLDPTKTALVVIDMQRDFIEPGGFGESLGNDVSLLAEIVPTVAALLASADVALAPGPHETFGLAALESLACGTPVVVSRTSALGEIITPDSGALADNEPAAIAQAVSAIVSRPEDHRRARARSRAEMFTWQRAAVGMLSTLGAASVSDDLGPGENTA